MKNKFFLFVFLFVMLRSFSTYAAIITPEDILGGSTATMPSYMSVSPSGSGNLNSDGSKAIWSNSDIKVTIYVKTIMTGVKSWRYRVSSSSGSTWGSWVVPSGDIAYPVLSDTGRYKIEIQTFNSSGTTLDTYIAGIYFVDKTCPIGVVSLPEVTNSETVLISFDNLYDTHSGLGSIGIKQYEDLEYDMEKLFYLPDKTFLAYFTLDKRLNIEEHYGKRDIYLCLMDYANNATYYAVSTTLIPKKPTPPVLVSPSNDTSFFLNETIPLTWTLEDKINTFNLPIKKTDILVTNKTTGDTKIYTVNGPATSFSINSLEKGTYDVSVKCYIWDNVYSESLPITINSGIFKNMGNVRTVSISPGTLMSYVAISTECDIPDETEITGNIYYKLKSDGVTMDRTYYIPFKVTNNYKDNIIRLLESSSKIEIEYVLKNNSTKYGLTPTLDSILVLAK